MWDYDKLFAEGNIVGLKNKQSNKLEFGAMNNTNLCVWKAFYMNEKLSNKDKEKNIDFEVQYIIRLDEHGNVAEKLFDRERDMAKPMPELETGMFIRVAYNNYASTDIGYVDKDRNVIVYQSGEFDYIAGPSGMSNWIYTTPVEVYGKQVKSFNSCNPYNPPIWRDAKYQAYLDSKSN